ncbi:MAG TPA: VapE domain-containing protein [Polyangiaceae bacterium]|nr:VapE domain-containing protein [Polyangiaceae bacterium]
MLIAALRYGKLGWPVFPCRPKDKTPACNHGFKDATKVPAEIIRFWKETPQANIGVATGGVSRLLVLDVDPRNGGDVSLAELQRLHGELPITVTVETGGDGQHHYFELPEQFEVKCSVLADGLDLKATGGYVLVPPSVHPSGKRYRWARPPSKQALAPAPDWLLESATKKPRPRQKVSSADQGDAADTPLGRLVAELGMLGRPGQDGMRMVVCPWQREHTTGAPLDSSTVIFPANSRQGLGGFKCFHSHCLQRSATEAFRELQKRRDAGSAETQWTTSLKRNGAGEITSTFRNVCLIVENDPQYGSRLRLDEMSGTVLHEGEEVTDNFVSQVRIDLEERYSVRANEANAVRAVNYVASKSKFHPVREFLEGLTWDGTPRLHRVAAEILRARASTASELDLLGTICKRWFISLVGRPLRPGLKVDTTLIIQGLQGTGKSTFFRTLAGIWFSDSDMPLDKDGMMQMAGAWISEWAELENVIGRNTISKVKAFLTSVSDRFRPPFGRTPITIKRSGVIVGSTNLQDFLSDPTGSRRFWVVPAGEVNLALLREWREQLLAEAVQLFRQNERHWLSDEEEAQRRDFVSQFTDTDVWEERVLGYASLRPHVRIADVLQQALDIPVDRQERRQQYRVTAILRRAGYEPQQLRIEGEKQRIWVAPKSATAGATGAPA